MSRILLAGLAAALLALPCAQRTGAQPATQPAVAPAMQSYLAHVAAAEASLRLDEPAAARRWLAAAPSEHRGFEWAWLAARLDQSTRQLADVDASIFQLAISPDGTRLVAAGAGGLVTVMDRDGAVLHRLDTGKGDVYRVAFSPDGTRLAAAGADKIVRVWRIGDTAPPTELRGFKTPITGVAFSPDGKTIYAAGYTPLAEPPGVDGTIRQWSLDTGEEGPEFRGGGGKPLSMLDISHNGKTLAASSWDGQVWLWDVDTRAVHKPLQIPDDGPYNAANSVAFDPVSLHLVVGSKDNTARLFNLTTGEEEHVLRHGGWVTSARFTRGTDDVPGRIVTTCADELLRVWDPARGELLATLAGHRGGANTVVITPEGKHAISAGQDGRLLEWALAFPGYGVLSWEGPNGCYGLSFTADGGQVLANGYDGTLRRYNSFTGRQLAMVQAHEKSSNWHATCSDGMRVVTSSWDKSLRVFDARTFELTRKIDLGELAAYHCAISPNGSLVAGAMGDKTARVYDAATGQEKFKLQGHTAGLHAVAFSPDGSLLATGGPDKLAKVWTLADEACIATTPAHPAGVTCVAFSPDGKTLATSAGDGCVYLWHADTGRPIWSTKLENTPLHRVTFSPDGKRLAAGGERAHLLDAATGVETLSVSPRPGDVYNLVFSPDGTRLAMCSTGDWIAIIDTAPTPDQVRRFQAQTDPAK